MTKLEQCIRLAIAINEDARVEITIDDGYFEAKVVSHDGELASGAGNTLDETIEDLYSSMTIRAKALRETLATFGDK